MKFFSRFNKKENPVGASLISPSQKAIGGAKEGQALIKEGYQRNVIVYRAIREIATAASSIKLCLFKGEREILQHPILDLLARPNPLNGQASFLGEIFTNLMITGEIAVVKSGPDTSREIKELWSMNPLDIVIEPGPLGLPMTYIHKKNNREIKFPVDQINGASNVFFMKLYNPLDSWRGQPPLRAAALSADAHNEGLQWNYSLMKNGARPSGVIEAPGAYPGAEVIARLQEWFKNTMQGSSNAGEVGILSGGATFKPMSENAKDMDFIAGMQEFSKYVSTAFGVPLPLIDNDAASYNNMEQAKERLWTDTVIPLVNLFLDSFNSWLAFFYGPGLYLKINEDAIPALEGLRNKRFERTLKAVDAGLLTVNEGREQIGFERVNDPNADQIFIYGGKVPLMSADIGYNPNEADTITEDEPTGQ